MDWAKTTARGYKKHLSFEICATYTRGFTVVKIDTALFCYIDDVNSELFYTAFVNKLYV